MLYSYYFDSHKDNIYSKSNYTSDLDSGYTAVYLFIDINNMLCPQEPNDYIFCSLKEWMYTSYENTPAIIKVPSGKKSSVY